MLKGSEVRNTTDFHEEARLSMCFMTTFEQLELMMQALDLSDLFNIYLHDDDIQDINTIWDQAPFTASEIPLENVLQGLYKMKIQGVRLALGPFRHPETRNGSFFGHLFRSEWVT